MNYIKEINTFYDTIERNPLSMPAITLWYALMHINNKAHWSDTFTVAVAVLQFKAGLTESTFKRARKELIEKGYITHQAGNQTQSATYRITRLTRDADETNFHPEPAHSTNQQTSEDVSPDQTQPTPSKRKQRPSTKPNTEEIPNHATTNKETPINNNLEKEGSNSQTNHHARLKGIKHQDMNPNMDPNSNPNTDANTAPLIKQNKTKPKQNETNNQHQADAIRFFQDNFGA